jgi:undecaprenyl-diphosphatase
MTTENNIGLRVHRDTIDRKTLPGLRSPGILGQRPVIGLTMFLAGMLIFGALAYTLNTNPSLTQWDLRAAQWFHVQLDKIPSSLVEYLIFGFFLGREIIVVIGIVLAIYCLSQHYWREFAMVLFGPGAGGLLWFFLSRYFDRPRPPTQADIVLSDPSFPSGHCLCSLLCYGLLAYLLIPKMPTRFWKWSVAVLLAFITVFVGLSRLLLGGHFVTDVIAGYAVGLAWAGLVYTLIDRFALDEQVTDRASVQTRISSEGLRTPGLFKRWPILGVTLVLIGSLSFAALGATVLNRGPLTQVDQSLYRTFITQAVNAPPRLNEIMIFGFFLGKQVILVLVTLVSIYFIYQRYWPELAMLLISSAAGSFVWNFFVNYFDRPRPSNQTGLAVTSIPSFPSGHAMSAIICYGFLTYLLIPKMPSPLWKWVLAIVALLVILFGGFSRIFQGSHYLTDVLAGYALGLAWASFVYTLIENIFLRKKV